MATSIKSYMMLIVFGALVAFAAVDFVGGITLDIAGGIFDEVR